MLIAVGVLSQVRALVSGTRRELQRWREFERQLAQQLARDYRLEVTGARREVCAMLTATVHELESIDRQVVETYRLFPLLDMLCDLEVIRHRCLTVTARAQRQELAQRVEELTGEPEQEILRDIAERRLAYWTEAAEAARRCDGQIAVITELIEALRLRVAIPDLPASGDAAAAARQLQIDDAAAAEVRALPSAGASAQHRWGGSSCLS